ncbi:MAG TPA: LA2681 family HEPN domain-containing protein [Terracidiphilus sp.]|jgi:tetratricopeptide (TPR) repeat protein|nr:LA2681 family HEPN domain-containing protein [Terracidiphilus sp.]
MSSFTYQDLEQFGADINDAVDTGNRVQLEALDKKAAVYCEDQNSDYAAYIWYFRSNIQAALQDLSDPRSWEWRQTHRERQILYLRRAASHPTFVRLAPVSQASILTNLANSLSSLGRGLEAIELYDAALECVPQFAMALGNRGSAMHDLLVSIPDTGHVRLVAAYADARLKAAVEPGVTWEGGDPSAGAHFTKIATHIESKIDPAKVIAENPLDSFSLGRSKEEQHYRRWALRHNLFLNPLQIIGPHAIAATDRMNLPSHVAPLGDPPEFIAWFNQMKQEYVGARWFLFEGLKPMKRHFADNEVFLVNTLDYPAFGMRVEKLRAAFRIAFSLLDKIAGFINAYYKLGMDAKRVDIRNIWHTKKGDLRPELLKKENIALRGLYWLALDIIGDEPADQDSIAPQAVELKHLRNLLEHRSLVVREMNAHDPMGVVETVKLADFEEHALYILKLARSALMYLAFSMRKEELDRSSKGDGFVPGIELPILT